MQNNNPEGNAGLRGLAHMKVFGILFLAVIIVLIGLSVKSIKPQNDFFAYNQLEGLLKAGRTDQIARVIITKGDSVIQLKIAGAEGMSSVVVPDSARESLIGELNNAGVPLDIREHDKSNFWLVLNLILLSVTLFVGVILVFRSIRVLILKAQ